MYAVEFTNLVNCGVKHYMKCHDYVSAWDTLRYEVLELEAAGWVEGEDFTAAVVDVEDDYDFDSQADWN